LNKNRNLDLIFFRYCRSTHEQSFPHAVAHSISLLIYCTKCCGPTISANVQEQQQ